jgi:hypothetical protein
MTVLTPTGLCILSPLAVAAPFGWREIGVKFNRRLLAGRAEIPGLNGQRHSIGDVSPVDDISTGLLIIHPA